MRHWIANAVLWGLFLSAVAVAQAEPNQRESNQRESSLASRLNWVHFRVVRGRLVACNPRLAKTKTESAEDSSAGCREVFSLTSGGCNPSVHYCHVDPAGRLEIGFHEGRQVRILREPVGGASAPLVEYLQPARGNVTLSITGAHGSVAVYEAASFWHLAVAEPQLCREHLIPALHRLRPDWELDQQLERIDVAMLDVARSEWIPQLDEWRDWVRQLASDDFADRRAADRRLRAAGQAVLPFLDSLDPARLDSEQRMRIRRITDDLTLREGDDSRRVAVWLSTQPSVWVRQLAHPDAERRSLAARRLALLRGRPVEFDPHAAPEQRDRQIRHLLDTLAAD